jgi:hypothetical protein
MKSSAIHTASMKDDLPSLELTAISDPLHLGAARDE